MSEHDIPTPAEISEDYATIAREGGPEAIGLIAQFMEHSARERESIEASLYAGMRRERDDWRERYREAEAELAAVRENFTHLLYPSPEQIERFRVYDIERVS